MNLKRKAISVLLACLMIVSTLITGTTLQAEAASGGFYVQGTTIYDANGNPFVMRGVNIAHAWYPGYTEQSIKGAAALGANTVRIVLANGQQWTKTTRTEVENIIGWCKDNKVVCVLEVHDATGSDSTSDLDRAVNYWKELKDLLNANRKYVIVNIANEWYGTWDGSGWANGYKSAIKSLRSAGIKNTLIVDCAGWGQYPASIFNYGKDVFNADSEGNTIFSIHMYEYAGGNASTVKSNIDNALKIGVPVIIGEFGCYHTNGDVDEYTIMSYCEQKGVGYLGWSWKGNNSDLAYLDIANDWSGSSLTTWGNTLFNDTNGIKNTASVCTVYTGSSSGSGSTQPSETATPAGVAHSGSVNVTGTWWSEKAITFSDLIGSVNASDVQKIVLSSDIDFIVGYNTTSGYSQLSGQKEYTLTDVKLDNSGYYFKVCISNNDQKSHTIKWDVYTGSSTVVTPTPTPAPTETPIPGNSYYEKVEFETANRFEQNGSNKIDSSMFKNYSGNGYVYLVSGWAEVGFTVPTAGKYRITLVSNADTYKENWLYLDNSGAGTLYTNGNQWNTYTAEYDLSAGTHKFGVSSNWGYTALDYVIIEAVN